MKAEIELEGGKKIKVDLNEAIDISIPLKAADDRVKAWYVDPIRIEAVRGEGFIGSVKEGGSVNFRDIHFNPHGHGTHTECLGHITPEVYSVNEHIREYFMMAQVLSIDPERREEDLVMTKDQIIRQLDPQVNALIIRSLPNDESKLHREYSGSNPPYIEHEALEELCKRNLGHLLLDMPSVDREDDGGELKAHHAFWNTAGSPRMNASITEMVYVPNEVQDGIYFMNLQFAPFENDASPSRPLLFPLK